MTVFNRDCYEPEIAALDDDILERLADWLISRNSGLQCLAEHIAVDHALCSADAADLAKYAWEAEGESVDTDWIANSELSFEDAAKSILEGHLDSAPREAIRILAFWIQQEM